MQRILTISPDRITTDARRFQFKSNGDRNGVTGILSGCTFNPIASNILLVWEPFSQFDNDIWYYVVDGHQRLNLAKQARDRGIPGVMLTCRILREGDGITAEKARRLGAVKNIIEGGGSTRPWDVAQLFRNGGDLDQVEGFLSNHNKTVQAAKVLASLSSAMFARVGKSTLDDYLIAEICRTYGDDQQRLAAIEGMERAGVCTLQKSAMSLIASVGFERFTELSLFGEQDQWSSNVETIADLLSSAKARLKATARTFSEAVEGQETLEATGNRLDREANQRALQRVEEASYNIRNRMLFDRELSALCIRCCELYKTNKNAARDLFIRKIQETPSS